MHKYVVERIEEPGSLPYWLVRHVFYRRETRVTKTIAKVYQPSFAVKIAAALNTLERRKTGQRKPPVQQANNIASVAIAAFKCGYGAAKNGVAGYTALRNFADWNGYNSALGE